MIYLLRIGDGVNSHYIYVKNIAHLLHMSNNSNCKGREFCPICKNKIYTEPLESIYLIVKNSQKKDHHLNYQSLLIVKVP